MDFRAVIIRELERQQMPRGRLAELAGMTGPRVSDYLNGHRRVTDQTLGRIFEALGVKLATPATPQDARRRRTARKPAPSRRTRQAGGKRPQKGK